MKEKKKSNKSTIETHCCNKKKKKNIKQTKGDLSKICARKWLPRVSHLCPQRQIQTSKTKTIVAQHTWSMTAENMEESTLNNIDNHNNS